MNSNAWNWCGHGAGTGSSAVAIWTPAVKRMKRTISMSGRFNAMCECDSEVWLMRRRCKSFFFLIYTLIFFNFFLCNTLNIYTNFFFPLPSQLYKIIKLTTTKYNFFKRNTNKFIDKYIRVSFLLSGIRSNNQIIGSLLNHGQCGVYYSKPLGSDVITMI